MDVYNKLQLLNLLKKVIVITIFEVILKYVNNMKMCMCKL